MRIESSYIFLRDLRFRAFHGVLEQERKVGADFLLSLRAACNMEGAVEADNLAATVNYAAIYAVVQREMAVPSQLLEHVAGRIGQAVFDSFPQVTALDIWLTKVNPPMGTDGGGAGVELHLLNDKTSKV